MFFFTRPPEFQRATPWEGERQRSVASVLLLIFLGDDGSIVLWLVYDDVVRHGHLRAHLPLRVMRHHDLHLDAEHALAHRHVPYTLIDVMVLRLARGDEVPIPELHGLCALCAELSRDDHLAPFAALLHHEAQDAVAGTARGETAQELVPERLRLAHRRRSTIFDALCEELHRVL